MLVFGVIIASFTLFDDSTCRAN